MSAGFSFATTPKSETINKYTFKNTYCNKLEISNFYQVYLGNEKEDTGSYYKFNIKKDKLKQYKIKSVVAKYYNYNETLFTKTYNGNKKQSLTFKGYEDYYLEDVLLIITVLQV